MTLGEYLRAQRCAKGIGLRQLARKIKIAPSTLSHLEHDRDRAACGERVLLRLARELGEEPESLLLRAHRLPPDVAEILVERPDLLRFIREHAMQAEAESGARSSII